MSEARRKRIRQPARSASRAADVKFWPAFVVLALFFILAGFIFLRSVMGTPPAETSEASTSASAEDSVSDASSLNAEAPGEMVEIQPADHVQPGQAHPPYNSDPPTSGWHLDTPVPAGFYEEPQLDEALVHNLEHGHVVIAYDCEKLTNCDEVKEKLKAIVERYDNWKVTVVPRSNKDAPIALTAWGRIDKLEDYDEERIVAFIDAYRNKGPENTPE